MVGITWQNRGHPEAGREDKLGSRQRVHFLISPEIHSTGHYLVRAARDAGCDSTVDQAGVALPELAPSDLLVYVDPGPLRFPYGVERCRARRVAFLIDVHQEIGSRLAVAELFDFIFIAQPDFMSAFTNAGHSASWLPLACAPDVHYVPGLERRYDVGFVGKLGSEGSFRHEVLTKVLSQFHSNDHRRFYDPLEMGRVYSASKIVINASINGDLNMRVFEAIAAGALLVTERIANGLPELFLEGTHLIAYSTPAEAILMVQRYLSDDAERERIARAGQRLVLERHTYYARWSQVTSIAAEPRRSNFDSARAYRLILEGRRDPARMIGLLAYQRPSLSLAVATMRAIGRAVNARVALTPNARRARRSRS